MITDIVMLRSVKRIINPTLKLSNDTIIKYTERAKRDASLCSVYVFHEIEFNKNVNCRIMERPVNIKLWLLVGVLAFQENIHQNSNITPRKGPNFWKFCAF